MLIRSSKQFARLGTICGLALLIASGITFAGEKIRFSDDQEKTASPGKAPNGDFSRSFDLKQISPGGTEVAPLPPPASASKTRNPKAEELIDQKKNWMFSTPAKTDRDSALKQILNVRDEKSGLGWDKKPKSAIDSYFERQAEARKEISAKLNARGKGPDANSKEEEPSDSRGTDGALLEQGTQSPLSPGPELEPNAWGKKGSELGSAISAAPGDISPRNFNSADVLGFPRHGFGSGASQFFGQGQREQHLEDFQKTLGVLNPARPALLRDPINFQSDGTRQPLNPVVGTGFSGVGAGLDPGFTSVGGLAGQGGSSQISDLVNSRLPSASSLSPAVIMPSTPSFMQRPALLEIPHRKF